MLLAFEAPSGPAWLFFGVGCAIVLGPVVAARLRLPPIVGLLAGGLVIGPNVTGVVPADDTTISALGQLGLLYLMFSAGAELDLVLFSRYRRAAITFGLMTFACPMLLGFASGQLLDFNMPASLLIGSVWASHTLVTYPMVRRAGLSGNGAVATAVGATVMTDTMSLLVLAGVSSNETGSSSLAVVMVELLAGLVALVFFSFVALPRATRWFFTGPGRDREARFAFLLAAMLSAAVLAEVVGIEGLVGAFFAGLGLNRLVPGAGLLMQRLEFFGSALLVPVFVVSVGLLIEPSVMVNPRTLGIAAVFAVAVVGGKALAALLAWPVLGFTGGEASLMFGLTLSQAAATLAATLVGYDIGLFGQRVVNAVLVVILVTLLVAALVTQRSLSKVTPTPVDAEALGRKLVVVPGRAASVPGLAHLSAALAAPDGGLVVPLLVRLPGEDPATGETLVSSTEAAMTEVGLDVEARTRLADSAISAVAYTTSEEAASLVVLDWHPASPAQAALHGDRDDALVAVVLAPVLLTALDERPFRRVVLALADDDVRSAMAGDAVVAAEVASRLAAQVEERILVGPAAAPRDAKLVDALRVFGSSTRQGAEDGLRDRGVWLDGELQPADLVVMPAHPDWERFGPLAARIAARPGVSVVVAADTRRWAARRQERWQLDALVGHGRTTPHWH